MTADDDLELLESEWRKTNRVSNMELVAIFPEAKSIVLEKLNRYKFLRQSHINNLSIQVKELKSTMNSEDYMILGEPLLKFLSPHYKAILAADKHIARLKNLAYLFNPKTENKVSWDVLKDHAKRVPIENISLPYLQRIKRYTNGRIVALCPFHQEKTPSFYLFTKDNCWHCFGCQQHGDVISFVMKINNLNFKEAVKLLTNY